MAGMHPSTQRLYRAAKDLKKIEGQSAVARLLVESPQTVKNWETRGVSKSGAVKAQSAIGCSANWVLDGTGSMLASTLELREPAAPGERYDALIPEEQRLIDNFRELVDDDDIREIQEVLATKAAKNRAIREKIMGRYGVQAAPVKHAADAKKTDVARAALRITEQLRQKSLFKDDKK